MRKTITLLAAIVLLCSSSTAWSQIYLKAPNVQGANLEGESTADRYVKQVDVLAYSMGIAGCGQLAKGSGGGAGACKSSISSLNFITTINNSVIGFKSLALTGKFIPFVELSFVKGTGDDRSLEYYKIRMEDVLVSSVQESGSGGERPTFSIELDAKRIAWAYRTQKADGSFGPYVSTGWNVATNAAWTFSF